MKGRPLGYLAGTSFLMALGWILTGQAAPSVHKGLPTDWTHRHVIFSNAVNPSQYAGVADDPRYLQQLYRHNVGAAPVVPITQPVTSSKFKFKPILHGDWSVSLGTGASLGPGNYPAKFGFNLNQASCSDYVVYSTGLLGSASQASIVGFTNLYSPGCAGSPTVNWAYKTGGAILTSPVLSLDGTQIAFVQTTNLVAGVGELVLLKWAARGSIGSPATPSSVSASNYRSCPTLPCMSRFTLTNRAGTPHDDVTSSVFYDYKTDVLFVGGATGWVHQFTGVFKGTPTELRNVAFPAHVATDNWTSSVVYDSVSNNVFLGDDGGFLYAVNASTGSVTASAQLDFGAGLVEAPIVDQTAGVLYVFASSDGTTNCGGGTVACAAVYQLSTTFGSGATGPKVVVGNSVAFPGNTPNPTYIGGFDSAFTNSASRTGNLYVCGNTGAAPILYQIPITGGAFPVSGLGTVFARLSTNTSTAACSAVIDIPNPNTAGGASERLFVSVRNNGRPTACSGGGCIMNFVSMPWEPNTPYSVGQQILSTKLHIETVVTAGTSGATQPAWSISAGNEQTDNTVTWIDQGVLHATTISGWIANHSYATATDRIIDSNGNVEVSTTTGTSGGSQPTWSTTPGGTTAEGPDTLVWTNAGPVATFALPSAGGASGVVEDNVVSDITQPGASQVYFSTLADQACGTGGTGGCAIQASQPALH